MPVYSPFFLRNRRQPTTQQELVNAFKNTPLSDYVIGVFRNGLDNKTEAELREIGASFPKGQEAIDFGYLVNASLNNMDINKILALFSSFKNHDLQQLGLAYYNFSSFTIEQLNQFISVLPESVHTLDISPSSHFCIPRFRGIFFHLLENLPKNISSLRISMHSKDFFPQLGTVLPETITALDLGTFGEIEFSADESLPIARSLPKNLKYLNIFGWKFNNAADFFANLPPTLEILEWEELEMNPATLINTIPLLPANITHIKFSYALKEFTDSQWISFFKALPENISSIDFGHLGNNFSYSKFELICKYLPPHVTSVKFNSGTLGDESPTEIQSRLSLLPPTVQSIDFKLNQFHFSDQWDKILAPSAAFKFIHLHSYYPIQNKWIPSFNKSIKTVKLSNYEEQHHRTHLKPPQTSWIHYGENTPVLELNIDFDSLAQLCHHFASYPDHIQQVVLNHSMIRRLDPNTREALRAFLKTKFKYVIFNTDDETSQAMPAIYDLIIQQNSSAEKPGLDKDLGKLILSYIDPTFDSQREIETTTEKPNPLSLLKEWIKKQPPAVKDLRKTLFLNLDYFCQTAEKLLEKEREPAFIHLAAFFTQGLLEGNISTTQYGEFLTLMERDGYYHHLFITLLFQLITVIGILTLLAVAVSLSEIAAVDLLIGTGLGIVNVLLGYYGKPPLKPPVSLFFEAKKINTAYKEMEEPNQPQPGILSPVAAG